MGHACSCAYSRNYRLSDNVSYRQEVTAETVLEDFGQTLDFELQQKIENKKCLVKWYQVGKVKHGPELTCYENFQLVRYWWKGALLPARVDFCQDLQTLLTGSMEKTM